MKLASGWLGRNPISRSKWKAMKEKHPALAWQTVAAQGETTVLKLPDGYNIACECGKTIVIPLDLHGKGITREALGRIFHEEPKCRAFLDGIEAEAKEAEDFSHADSSE